MRSRAVVVCREIRTAKIPRIKRAEKQTGKVWPVSTKENMSVYGNTASDELLFVCVGVMYSGEYDVCGVTLSVHPHRAS
jgi:hypothetical protein